jgi:hypothetical protein
VVPVSSMVATSDIVALAKPPVWAEFTPELGEGCAGWGA